MAQTEVEVPEAADVETRPAVSPRVDGPKSDRTVVIRPATRWPRLDIAELWHYRELLGTFVWRDIKVRYKQTVIGVLWALIQPVFTIVVYVVIYGKFAKFPSGNTKYPVLVTAGYVPMAYFTSSLTGSAGSIVGGGGLVSKVYFPRLLLPLAAVMVPAVDLLLSFSVMLGVMGWYGIWPHGPKVALAPVFLLLALGTALGLGLFLSAVNVRYRDVQYTIPVFLPLLPLLSGVVFEFSKIPQKWQWILSINPMTTAIAGWRWSLLGAAAPDLGKSAVGVGVAVTLFALGLAFFRSSEPRFADLI